MIDANFGINIGQEFQSGPTLFPPDNVFPTQQFQNDLDYLWNLGIRYVRIGGANWTFSPAIDMSKTAALMAKAKGFHVSWGVVQVNNAKPSNWAGFLAAQPSYVQWAQDNTIDICLIGNEHEATFNLGRDAIVSMSRTANVITIVTAQPHLMQTGDAIVYYNAASGNGTGSTLGVSSNSFHSITVINATTFTFSSTGSDGTTTIGWWQYSNDTVRNFMKRLATSLKASGLTIPLSYSVIQGVETAPSTTYISRWVNTIGRGDIDYLDLNIYGTPTDEEQRLADFVNEVRTGYNALGASHFRVTEWNLFAQNGNGGKPTNRSRETYYMMQRLRFLQSLSGLKYYHFCFRRVDDLLVVKKGYRSNINDASYRDWWWQMIGQRPKNYEVSGTPKFIYTLRQSPGTVIWSGMGMNYGQHLQPGMQEYVASEVANDLDYLKSHGIKKIRMGFGDLAYTSGVNAVKQACLDAKARGLYVVAVAAATGLNDSNWSTYTSQVNTLADWCLTNHIDEFQIGNEIEGDYNWSAPGALTNVISKIKTMATDVKNNHFTTGKISYAMAQDRLETDWISGGKGDLDYLGYNVYGSNGEYADWQTKILAMKAAFGSGFYISEWNLHYNWNEFPQPESEQAAEIATRRQWLQDNGITLAYFFTYKWRTSADQFALIKGDGSYRAWWASLFKYITRANISGSRSAVATRPTI